MMSDGFACGEGQNEGVEVFRHENVAMDLKSKLLAQFAQGLNEV